MTLKMVDLYLSPNVIVFICYLVSVCNVAWAFHRCDYKEKRQSAILLENQ
jgi:hypothetical protein